MGAFSVAATTVRSLFGYAAVQWFRLYDTSRNVAGSRPDEVNEFT
jgi:hypothetical protein